MRTACVLIALVMLGAFATPSPAADIKAVQMASELTSQASEHMSRMEYDEALDLLKKALELNPGDLTAMRYLAIYNQQVLEPLCKSAAQAYFSGHYPVAISKWEEIINIAPSESRRVQSLIDTAIIDSRQVELEQKYLAVDRLMEEKRYAQATEVLEAIIAAYPKELPALVMLSKLSGSLDINVIQDRYVLARELMAKGEYDSAIKELENIVELDSKQELAKRLIIDSRREKLKELYGEAKELLSRGQYLLASAAFSKVQKNNPTDHATKDLLSRLDDVIRITQSIAANTPTERVLLKSIYHYVSAQGEPKISVAASWYAVQLEPRNPLAHAIRDFIESKNARTIRQMDSPVSEMHLVEQYLFAALNHIYEGRYDLTVEKCGIVLELSPGNILALKRMGSAYYLMGKKSKAKGVWQKAIKLYPKDDELKGFMELLKN